MNPDWTFPTQPDQLNPCVNQGSVHSDFFGNHDALNATLLDDSPIRITEQCTPSSRLGLSRTDSDLILECAWTSPDIYGDQHDTFGGLALDDELFPPLFDLVEEVTYPNIVTEPSTPTPQLPQATEQPYLDPTLLHDPSVNGRQGSSIPGDDLSRPVCVCQGSGRKYKAPKERPSRRAKLSAAASHILETHFSNNAYPDKGELSQLNKRTGLGVESIRTWFSNIRHRRAHGRASLLFCPSLSDYMQVKMSKLTVLLDFPVAPPPQEMRERPRQSTPISVEGLNQLNRVSPAHSTSSLQRYLATPFTEEPILPAATQSFSQALAARRASDTELEAVIFANMERLGNLLPPDLDHSQSLQSAQTRQDEEPLESAQRPDVARSRAGSQSSRGSGKSHRSWTSQNSNRSRGSRRGRKNWVRASNMNTINAPPQTEDAEPVTAETSEPPWYCTSLDCDKSFKYRSEWDRHEAAVHHWPYHWVCNLGDENSLVHKDAKSRIFFRVDQLLAHMRKAHPETYTLNSTASQLKTDNPDFDPNSLVCGFCSQSLPNWEERQSHVFAHLESGVLKSWLSLRHDLMSRIDREQKTWERWDGWLRGTHSDFSPHQSMQKMQNSRLFALYQT
ncbi:hypothetical protein BKA58DRAFT_28971 [Alternaria rosae]|uniref:uncharacterized protein n=1 Tax=Alternaria rosae TaxID=1187941 RepID=UPI001E8E09D5|nr:uncharacterized protein BKA58DRAFT_28971 [Alternaria rosae]KAH6883039.1 hypothetical protein BKA58DRAFT_28971 [Alternaria rosae]